jgi:hypothetical protein
MITSAARLLLVGNPLAALDRVALRNDPPAVALRGIAMAQLGDYDRARKLLRRAAQQFGPRERLARARCHVAEAEVALAARILNPNDQQLEASIQTLEQFGDRINAVHARLLAARRQLLLGEVEAAAHTLSFMKGTAELPSALAARADLTRAELALRRFKATEAAAALDCADASARASRIPALIKEV